MVYINIYYIIDEFLYIENIYTYMVKVKEYIIYKEYSRIYRARAVSKRIYPLLGYSKLAASPIRRQRELVARAWNS